MLWEYLVTDGHVRSTRLRRLQPWIIALGIILVQLGLIIIRLAPLIRPEESVAAILLKRVSVAQSRANIAFKGLAQPSFAPEDLASLPPAKEVAEVIDATLRSLQQTDTLPDDLINFVEMEPETLWKGDWGIERVNHVKSGDMYLLAANLNSGSESRPKPVRWVGIFKKLNGTWQYTSIAVSGMYVPQKFLQVEPSAIPIALGPVLPNNQ
jgi:hypothetical protein